VVLPFSLLSDFADELGKPLMTFGWMAVSAFRDVGRLTGESDCVASREEEVVG